MPLSGSGILSLGSRKPGLTVFKTSSFDPKTISGLTVWLKADAITGKNDGDAIASWPDSNGGAAWANATGANQPIYKTAIQNGKPVVRFNGTSHRLQVATGLAPGSNLSWFFAIKPSATTNGGLIDTAPSAANTFRNHNVPSSGSIEWHNAAPTIAGIYATTNAQILVFDTQITSQRQIDFWRNDSRVTPTSTATNVSTTAMAFGATGANASRIGSINDSAAFFAGDYYEVLLYTGPLSDANRKLVTNYLAAKWGITVS